MEVTMRRIVTLVAVASILAACTSGAGGTTQRQLVPLTDADGGSTIEVAVGDHLQVELEGNPSTGFSWVDETEETAVIVAVGEPQFIEQSGLVGASGVMRCMFEARASGEATIVLAYRRPWEDDAEPERVFRVTVVVRSA